MFLFSIYVVHDEVKDKQFELELSWVGSVTQGRHQRVPQDVFAEAERYAKSALEEDSEHGPGRGQGRQIGDPTASVRIVHARSHHDNVGLGRYDREAGRHLPFRGRHHERGNQGGRPYLRLTQ